MLLRTDTFGRRSFCAQKPLNTDAVTQNSMHTGNLFHTEGFLLRSFYVPKSVRTETIYSQLLYTEAFTQGRFYTGRLSHRLARAETKSALRHTGDPCRRPCRQPQNPHLITWLDLAGDTEFTRHHSAKGCRSQFRSHPDGRRPAQPPEERSV